MWKIWNQILRDAEMVEGGGVAEPEIQASGAEPEVVKESAGAEAGGGKPGKGNFVPQDRFDEVYRTSKEQQERADKAERERDEILADLQADYDQPYRPGRGRADAVPRELPPEREPAPPPQQFPGMDILEEFEARAKQDPEIAAWSRAIKAMIARELSPIQAQFGKIDQTYGGQLKRMQEAAEAQRRAASITPIYERVYAASTFKDDPIGPDLMQVAVNNTAAEVDANPQINNMPERTRNMLIERILKAQVKAIEDRMGQRDPARATVKNAKAAEALKRAPVTAEGKPGSPPEKDDLIEQHRAGKTSGSELIAGLVGRGFKKAGLE